MFKLEIMINVDCPKGSLEVSYLVIQAMLDKWKVIVLVIMCHSDIATCLEPFKLFLLMERLA